MYGVSEGRRKKEILLSKKGGNNQQFSTEGTGHRKRGGGLPSEKICSQGVQAGHIVEKGQRAIIGERSTEHWKHRNGRRRVSLALGL